MRFDLRKRKRVTFPSLGDKNNLVSVMTALAGAFLVLLVLGSVLALGLFTYYAKDLPSPNRLVTREVELSTKIFDRNGQLLFDVYRNVDRTLVKLSDMPDYLIKATLATEDAEFFLHHGFDLQGMLRAVKNIVLFRRLEGGSTITQQLVKNALLTNQRSLSRKLKELVLALQIEKKFSKQDILQIYLNEVPYGGPAWGIGAAAQYYFAKNPKDLTLAEAAFLAGLPQSPSVYSPYGPKPENAKARQSYVLHLMNTKGWVNQYGTREFLSRSEVEKAKVEPLNFVKPEARGIKAPHFVMYVKKLLEEKYGTNLVESGGLQVTTTLDLSFQEQLEKIVSEEIEKAKALKVGNGALVAIDPNNGQIISLVGSKDYFDTENDGNFDVAADGLRQPGSSIKPITYVTAFEKGYTAATMIVDTPVTFPGGPEGEYKPVNYDGRYRGPLSLRTALGSSINIVAVKLLKIVGIESVLDTASRLGITTLNDPRRYSLSLTLGGGEVTLLEMTGAYATFATGGIKQEITPILEVKDSQERVLEKYRERPGTRIISEGSTYILSHILSDDGARSLVFGPNSLLNIPNVAVKTGTTNDKKDNWAIGYSTGMVVGVWVGNNDNTPMDPRLASGITGASPIWRRAMLEALKTKPAKVFNRPGNIDELPVDSLSGMLPTEGFPARLEVFVRGTEPRASSDIYTMVKVCKIDGKIANQTCEDQGQVEEKRFIKLHDPNYEWQDTIDKWVEENYKDRPEFNPPKEQSTS